jgi:hypothetical protein
MSTNSRLRSASRSTRALALLAVGLIVAASCGSSGSGANEKTVAGGSDFGTLKNVCHPARTPNKDHTDRGVTADSIRLTSMSDAGSTIRTGLNQELLDASRVFTKWCNAHGGINGRKIILSTGDAQLTLYRQAISTACGNAFALVGGGGVFDDQGQKQRVECLLPDFPGLVTSSAARASALMFQAVPLSVTQYTSGLLGYISKTYPDSLGQIGYVTGNLPSLQLVKDQIRVSGEQQYHWGTDVAYSNDYNTAAAPSWTEPAKAIKDKGIKGLVFVGEPSDLASLLISIRSIGYTGLEWVYSMGNTYDQSLIRNGGAALDVTKVYLLLNIVPFEKASSTPAMQKYLSLFDKYEPQGKARALLGVQSFAAWLMFAKAADACGPTLDRKCLVREAGRITDFDGGGLTVPSDPAAGSATDCFAAERATSKGFVGVDVDANDGLFNCKPDNVWTLQDFDYTKYGTPVSLGDVGKSLDDLP